jgi:transcription antitermination factor NusG
MAHAYTPGLKVTDQVWLVKERILPLKGDVIVSKGDRVEPDTVVAQTHLPGPVEPVNVANILGVPPEDIPECMLKKEGDPVKKGEVIARSASFFGLFKSECTSKTDGTIENVSHVTGQVLLRGQPMPVQVKAYLKGEVIAIHPDEGVSVAAIGAFVQGIFGIGGETHGEIKVVCADHNEVLDDGKITPACAGKVVVGGSQVTAAALKKAIQVGAKGIVVGGFDDRDLRDFLGYDLGVAITGSEGLGITLVVTEGFGQIAMAQKTFELLKRHEGKLACINGATQIRAGVIRPEVVIPKDIPAVPENVPKPEIMGLTVGSPVRVIRQPHFGRLGRVSNLPAPLQQLESESSARVLEVEFDGKERAIIPRANVEMIEEV